MADEETKDEAKDEKKDAKKDGGKKDSGKKAGPLRKILLMLVIVILSSAAGGATGYFLMAPPQPDDQQGEPRVETDEIVPAKPSGPSDTNTLSQDYSYYEFDPLTVNLRVDRLNRYIRCTIVLAMQKEDAAEATALINRKKIELTNWIMTYLAGLTLDEVSGRKNIVRIQREIRDEINKQLWPDRRPRINHVLFKDFAIQ
jgi:flagellar basal body-associated protein FliL